MRVYLYLGTYCGKHLCSSAQPWPHGPLPVVVQTVFPLPSSLLPPVLPHTPPKTSTPPPPPQPPTCNITITVLSCTVPHCVSSRLIKLIPSMQIQPTAPSAHTPITRLSTTIASSSSASPASVQVSALRNSPGDHSASSSPPPRPHVVSIHHPAPPASGHFRSALNRPDLVAPPSPAQRIRFIPFQDSEVVCPPGTLPRHRASLISLARTSTVRLRYRRP